jgi:YfiH family protein
MATWQTETPAGVILTHTTTRAEGDFAIDAEPAALAERRRRVADRPWVWVRQVHGAEVVVATREIAAEVAGIEADAMVTADPGLVLAIQTADCVPITFWSDEGIVGVAHAGWRGLEAGVVERTIEAMWALGAGVIQARTGPFIEAACYEFGSDDLDRLAARFGEEVRATTRDGRPGLDLFALTDAAVVDTVRPVWPVGLQRSSGCTACDAERFFSHRARADTGRMATIVWRETSYDRATATG